MDSLQSAALRLSEDIHQVVIPFNDVLGRTPEGESPSTRDNDVTLLVNHLKNMIHSISGRRAEKNPKMVCSRRRVKKQNPQIQPVIFSQLMTAAAAAMQATNAKHRMFRKEEVAYHMAAKNAVLVEEKWFESIDAAATAGNPSNELKTLFDTANKLEENVCVYLIYCELLC